MCCSPSSERRTARIGRIASRSGCALALALTGACAAAACGGPQEPAARGERCFRAADCVDGLVCIEHTCTDDLSGIVHTAEPPAASDPEEISGGDGGGGDGAAGLRSDGGPGGAGGAGGVGTGGAGTGGAGTGGAGGVEDGGQGGTGAAGADAGGEAGAGGNGGTPPTEDAGGLPGGERDATVG